MKLNRRINRCYKSISYRSCYTCFICCYRTNRHIDVFFINHKRIFFCVYRSVYIDIAFTNCMSFKP
nr:MAG TPA: hypothetical protein [Caudoviricetes sp.]